MKTIAFAALLAVTAGAVHAAPGYYYNATPRYYEPAPVYAPADRGHWENVTTRSWVPAHWEVRRDQWGREVRVFERGHETFLTNRVWVDGRRW